MSVKYTESFKSLQFAGDVSRIIINLLVGRTCWQQWEFINTWYKY